MKARLQATNGVFVIVAATLQSIAAEITILLLKRRNVSAWMEPDVIDV